MKAVQQTRFYEGPEDRGSWEVSPAATPWWPEHLIVDGREVPVVIDPMLPDYVGVCEWNMDFQGGPTTPKRIVLRAREGRVLLHEALHCLLGDNEALVRRATKLYELGWRLTERPEDGD